MDVFDLINLEDCPLCDGAALLEEENGCSFYVMCLDCGCHSVSMNYKTENQKLEAAKSVALLWNKGKVIKPTPGE